MQGTKAERKQVFLLTRAIFAKPSARVHGKKQVRKVLAPHLESLKRPYNDLGAKKFVAIICDLLERGVYESQLKAAEEFPKLFQHSPEQETTRETAEVDAAQLVAEILRQGDVDTESEKDPTYRYFNEDDTSLSVEIEGTVDLVEAEASSKSVCNTTVSAESEGLILDTIVDQEPGLWGLQNLFYKQDITDTNGLEPDIVGESKSTKSVIPEIPTLRPLRLPYGVQHFILTEVQMLLEECCFDFAQRWLPDLLKKEDCDCAIAIELNKWCFLLQKQMHRLPPEAMDTGVKELRGVLVTVIKLRHSAVHRLKLPARDVQKMIDSALTFTCLLGDDERAARLQRISTELRLQFSSMEMMKNDVENTALASLKEIQRKREELAVEEEAIIAGMFRHDAQSTSSIGVMVQDSICRILRDPPNSCSIVGMAEELYEDEGEEEEIYHDSSEEFVDAALPHDVGSL